MSIYCLYWIHTENQCDPLNEGYIGVTKNLKKRICEHKKSNYVVGRALKKYKNVCVDVLKTNMSKSEAFTLELSYRPHPNTGWNIASGGRGGVGEIIPTLETRNKMSEAWNKRYEKYGGPCANRPDIAEKISKTYKEKYANGYINNRKGCKLSDSQKKKQRIAALNRPKDCLCVGCNKYFTIQGLMSHTRHKDCNGYRFEPPSS